MVLIRKVHDHPEILANLAYKNVTTIFLKAFLSSAYLGAALSAVFEICQFLVAGRYSPNYPALKGIILEKDVWFNS